MFLVSDFVAEDVSLKRGPGIVELTVCGSRIFHYNGNFFVTNTLKGDGCLRSESCHTIDILGFTWRFV